MSNRIPAEVRKVLEPGEKVLWVGTPKMGSVLRPIDAVLIPITVIWAILAFAWEGMALASLWQGFNYTDLFLSIIGAPLVCLGAYMSVGRYVLDFQHRSSTLYCITPKRALIVTLGEQQQVRSLDLLTLNKVSCVEREGGRGTIVFGERPVSHEWADHFKVAGVFAGEHSRRDLFEMIPDAQSVLALIHNIRDGKSPQPLV